VGELELLCLPENFHGLCGDEGLVQRQRSRPQIESLALMDVYGRVARALLSFSAEDQESNLRDSRQGFSSGSCQNGGCITRNSRVMKKDLEEHQFHRNANG
jgi:hypothetical protein